ncbi:MAG: hypothetical protein A49_11650 [Methyloceanibacter sp.]|nr:MAG: hypothetical protein A49_11650 [Methyloceanibacter sp.]
MRQQPRTITKEARARDKRTIDTFIRRYRHAKNATSAFHANASDLKAQLRLATATRPLLREDSDTTLERVLKVLRRQRPFRLDDRTAQRLLAFIDHIKLGKLVLALDGRSFTSEQIYEQLATHYVFTGTPRTPVHLEFLDRNEALHDHFWTRFYSYQVDMMVVASRLFDVYQITHRIVLDPTTWVEPCIFCKKRAGPFTSEEHTFPEALGNTNELLLPEGFVCDPCNNVLSRLDQKLVEFAPISYLRVMNVPLTKKGKFPHLQIGDFRVERTGPASLLMNDPKAAFTTEAKPVRGGVSWTVTLKGKRSQLLDVARGLYKIALGSVAMTEGREFVLNERFDAARTFILFQGPLPNPVFTVAETKPVNYCRLRHQIRGRSQCVLIEIFGTKWFLNLTTEPKLSLTPEMQDAGIIEFYVGDQ